MSVQAASAWEHVVSASKGTRRERLTVTAIAVLLVLLRSIVPTIYEGFYFDSDQAIIGLMAKHLSAVERFPLFYDGLNYILGVEAWITSMCRNGAGATTVLRAHGVLSGILADAVTPNALDVALHRLRKKLQAIDSALQIVNTRGHGYALRQALAA